MCDTVLSRLPIQELAKLMSCKFHAMHVLAWDPHVLHACRVGFEKMRHNDKLLIMFLNTNSTNNSP